MNFYAASYDVFCKVLWVAILCALGYWLTRLLLEVVVC
jgi:hypothetical protein